MKTGAPQAPEAIQRPPDGSFAVPPKQELEQEKYEGPEVL